MDRTARVVEVVEYDRSWPEAFEIETQRLRSVLPPAATIEHIGSTSVPGLAAKPIIDIMVVMAMVADVVHDVSPFERLGYEYRPLAFPEDSDHLFFVKDSAGVRTHHLHVFDARSPEPRANRVFREFLVTHPEAAARYAAAKRTAAQAHPDSRARYGKAKEAVTFELLEQATRWGEDQQEPSGQIRLAPDQQGC
jgi:GrpB-like predicted nucleotidyltransferase (UPF0157 family)